MTDERITTLKGAQQLVKDFAARNDWKNVPNIDKFDQFCMKN